MNARQVTESTSAKLRRAEQDRASLAADLRETREAFAASQADLTRVERERDEAKADGDRIAMRLVDERVERYKALDAINELMPQLNLAEAELVSARTELDNLARSHWIVARDGGRSCARCDQEIRRGEAYALMPAVDLLEHIHCPDREGAAT